MNQFELMGFCKEAALRSEPEFKDVAYDVGDLFAGAPTNKAGRRAQRQALRGAGKDISDTKAFIKKWTETDFKRMQAKQVAAQKAGKLSDVANIGRRMTARKNQLKQHMGEIGKQFTRDGSKLTGVGKQFHVAGGAAASKGAKFLQKVKTRGKPLAVLGALGTAAYGASKLLGGAKQQPTYY